MNAIQTKQSREFEAELPDEIRLCHGIHYTGRKAVWKTLLPARRKLSMEMRAACQDALSCQNFLHSLRNVHFLDPACGTGNFLAEAYSMLKGIEQDAIAVLRGRFGIKAEPTVAMSQMHGIELLPEAASKALELLKRSNGKPDIICANALATNWMQGIPDGSRCFIAGNPPFRGARLMNARQKQEMHSVFGKSRRAQDLDYCAAWIELAGRLVLEGKAEGASFIATSSICQGEQASLFWKPLITKGIAIQYAVRPFEWSASSNDASVHCIIAGFGKKQDDCLLETEFGCLEPAVNISCLLEDFPDAFIEARKEPLDACTPRMLFGSQPRDGCFLLMSDAERNELLDKEPQAKCFLKRYVGAREMLHGHGRWCIWMDGINGSILDECPSVKERIAKVKAFREASKAKTTKQQAKNPHLFAQITRQKGRCLVFPSTVSCEREWTPIRFLEPDEIASNACYVVCNAELWHFAVLQSMPHMAWMRMLCGRLEKDLRYSAGMVYNTFPWPKLNQRQRDDLSKKAQKILTERKISGLTLADAYGKLMPCGLRNAHRELDAAVVQAYGWEKEANKNEVVANLLNMLRKRLCRQDISSLLE